jgi:hypothetical protein
MWTSAGTCYDPLMRIWLVVAALALVGCNEVTFSCSDVAVVCGGGPEANDAAVCGGLALRVDVTRARCDPGGTIAGLPRCYTGEPRCESGAEMICLDPTIFEEVPCDDMLARCAAAGGDACYFPYAEGGQLTGEVVVVTPPRT